MKLLTISLEARTWQQKAQEAKQERFLERCFDISAGGYGGIGLGALVESRFQRG
jgi:hypothetical protein